MPSQGYCIYIGKLPFGVTLREITSLFDRFGKITRINFNGRYAHLYFATSECASNVIANRSHLRLLGRRFKVEAAHPVSKQETKMGDTKCLSAMVHESIPPTTVGHSGTVRSDFNEPEQTNFEVCVSPKGPRSPRITIMILFPINLISSLRVSDLKSRMEPIVHCCNPHFSLFTSDTDPEPLDAGTLLIDPKTGQPIAGSSSDNPFYYDKVYAEPTSDGDRKRKYQQSELLEECRWRACDQRCENLPSEDPPDHTYIDLERPVQEAMAIIRRMVEISHRIGPLNLCRMPRGGKTTLLRALFDALNADPDFYPIIISAAGYGPSNQNPLQAIVQQIASPLAVIPPAEHAKVVAYSLASVGEQLKRIQNETQRHIVLLIDDLDNFGNPVDSTAHQYLIKEFLDAKGRYLVYTSCLNLRFGGSSEFRMTKFVQMPLCTNRALLHTLPHAEGLDDLLITVTGGVPSLIGLELSRRAGCGKEKTLEQMFLDIVGAKYDKHQGPFDAQRDQMEELLHTLLLGSPSVLPFFERFADRLPVPVSESHRFPYSRRVWYSLAYIPLIVRSLGEEDAYLMYQDLYSAAEQQVIC